jgi:Protein of unknown function (DUF1579)
MYNLSTAKLNAYQRAILFGALFGLWAATPALSQEKQGDRKNPQAGTAELPAMARNGLPGEMHKRLGALVGEWDVEVATYVLDGAPEKPAISRDYVCRREWIAETGNRHLRDVTQGTGGNPYYRLGILSYSTMDNRYEWNTVDALNANMMTYKGAKGSGGKSGAIEMSGEFTDQGILGASYVGKNIQMRTVIKIESQDRNALELYFTPPGEGERLIQRFVYTRRR